MKKKTFIYSAIAALFVWVFSLGTVSVFGATTDPEAVIANHVSIGGVDVSGMTVEEAKNLLTEKTSAFQDTSFVLTTGDKSMQVTGTDLGLSWGNPQVVEEAVNVGKSGNLLTRFKDKKELEKNGKSFDVIFTIDDTETAALLNANADMLGERAMSAGLSKTADGFVMTDGHQGVSVDVPASLEAIRDYIKTQWDGNNATITLVTVVTDPSGTSEDLSRVKDVLGSFHTDFSSSSSARCTNIERAASLINGSIIYPGEEFSVVATIGPTDAANGYELAGAYENGQTVEAYGGGVCQVSSTLYNAVLNSELKVTTRSPHSMLVSYVEPSRDAAIAVDSGKDFKFVNSTDAPIYIEGYTKDKQLYFTIYGEETRPENRTISFESEVTSQSDRAYSFVPSADPIGTIVTTSSAHIGKNAELWKTVYLDGVEQSREKVNSSSYRGTPQTVVIGIGSPDPTATAAVSAAIATGDAYTVYNTVAAYSGNAAAASRANNVLSERAQTAQINGADAAAQAAVDAAAAAATPEQAAAEQAAAAEAAAAAAAATAGVDQAEAESILVQ